MIDSHQTDTTDCHPATSSLCTLRERARVVDGSGNESPYTLLAAALHPLAPPSLRSSDIPPGPARMACEAGISQQQYRRRPNTHRVAIGPCAGSARSGGARG